MPRRDLRQLPIQTTPERSRIMGLIRSSNNATTESRLRALMRANRIVGWRRRFRLVGSPDFTFPKQRVVVFVDGCFWHGCPLHGHVPRTNELFWMRKLLANRKRDGRVNRLLRNDGWYVIRLWEHDLVASASHVVARLRRGLRRVVTGPLSQASHLRTLTRRFDDCPFALKKTPTTAGFS